MIGCRYEKVRRHGAVGTLAPVAQACPMGNHASMSTTQNVGLSMPVSLALIIPSYNRADLIGETIDAALSQAVPFEEIIVVDDGSTDHTLAVLAAYGDAIRVIACENGGVQVARNRGVAAAHSSHVTFCDSDDLLEPAFAGTMRRWFSEDPLCDAAYCNLRKFAGSTVDPDDFSQAPASFLRGARISGEFAHDIPDLYLRLFTVHPFYISGCTVRKAFYEAIGGFDPQFLRVGAEDGEFTLRAAASGRLAYCTTPLARVRRHEGNESVNPLHVIVGSAHILEFASKHHRNAAPYHADLRDEARRLRLEAGDSAFARGMFDVAAQMFGFHFDRPIGMRHRVKRAVVHLPEPLRSLAWKITQR